MSARLRIVRAAPLSTIQDDGRPGLLATGISASGPMHKTGHAAAGRLAGAVDQAGIEMTRAGLDMIVEDGVLRVGWAGGLFTVAVNGQSVDWPGGASLQTGDTLSVTPGAAGNYGYLRFGGRLDVASVMGSRATNMRARLGGIDGRALRAGDILRIEGSGGPPGQVGLDAEELGPIRFVWGIHASHFAPEMRDRFVAAAFRITSQMDRMGVRLSDDGEVFAGRSMLSLVSEPILAGDIQILGDGTPIVLMRDHQPTGGYPRIGTVITADLDRFAQMRPGEAVLFAPVSVEHAHRLLRSSQA